MIIIEANCSGTLSASAQSNYSASLIAHLPTNFVLVMIITIIVIIINITTTIITIIIMTIINTLLLTTLDNLHNHDSLWVMVPVTKIIFSFIINFIVTIVIVILSTSNFNLKQLPFYWLFADLEHRQTTPAQR